MLKATVNNQQAFDIQEDKGRILVNGLPFDWDMVKIENGKFHIIKNHRSFSAEVIEANYAEKTFTLRINRSTFTVNIKDRFDLLLDQMGMSSVALTKLNNLKAPMPGKILEVKVAVGDMVVKGDTLIILEAMKMENVIKAPGDGKVKALKVNKAENVEKNQVLIEFES